MRTILTYRFPEEIVTESKDEVLIKNELIRMLVNHLKANDAEIFDAFTDDGPKDHGDDVFMPIDEMTGERVSIIDIVAGFGYDFDLADFKNHEEELNSLMLAQLSTQDMVLENFWNTSEQTIRHTYFNLSTK